MGRHRKVGRPSKINRRKRAKYQMCMRLGGKYSGYGHHKYYKKDHIFKGKAWGAMTKKERQRYARS